MDQKIIERAKSWLTEQYDEETRKQVKDMLDNDPNELTESFYRNLEFGTGGLRGIMGAGTNRMNIYTVAMATQGFANYIKKMNAGKKELSVAISYDDAITARPSPTSPPMSCRPTASRSISSIACVLHQSFRLPFAK